jgi:excisionase family DNA binding protein
MANTTFLTGKDVAEILKISKALAYRLIARGEIPGIRFGRTVRVKQESLDAFIVRNEAEASDNGILSSSTKLPNSGETEEVAML